MSFFSETVLAINTFLWGAPMLFMLIGVGLFLSFKTGFVQIRRFKFALSKIKNSIIIARKDKKKHSVSPFQSFATALGATIGIGNIVGVAGAIALGGPGAIFWMWVAGVIGMATKYSEIVLAVRFREYKSNGTRVGGPMYYIKKGLGSRFSPLGGMFAVFGCFAVLGTGNLTQVNAVAGSVNSTIISFFPSLSQHHILIKLIVGLLLALLIGITMLGGARRVGFVAERLVPFMAILYLLCATSVIILNIDKLFSTLLLIVHSAFNPTATIGGIAGITLSHCLRLGFGRGVFSNEAGLGTSPISYAASDANSAVEQGLLGVIEVFVDTIVICTVTALLILMSGIDIPFGEVAGIELATAGFSSVFGAEVTSVMMSIMIVLFAFSSMLAWSVYGIRCFESLFGSRGLIVYQVIYVVFTVLGSVLQLSIVWDMSSAFNGLMAIPNLIALTLLSGEVKRLTKEYFA